MKKISFLMILIILFSFVRINAQPTLTAATNNPIVGDYFTQIQTPYEDPGSAGANVTWDFSNILTLQTLTNTFVLPSATPYAATFPSANLASVIDNGSTPYYTYYVTNSTVFSIAGLYIPFLPSSIPYSDPEKLIQFPMTYNTTYTDNFACDISGYDRHGSVTVTADGYGTLIMPYGTVTNVLRVKASETYADYTSGTPVTNYTSLNYYWYKPGIRNNILQLSILNVNGNLYQQYGLYIDVTTIGIDDITAKQDKEFKCYPVPAKDKITVEIPQQKNNNCNLLIITNISGEEVIKTEISVTSVKSEIDISMLKNGIYFVKLITDNKVETRKIIKQ